MRPRRIRTLTVALICAAGPHLAAAQISEGLRLKLERQLHLAPIRPERDSAKFLEADSIVGEHDRSIVATGNVTLRQMGATIRADRVEYSAADQTAVATGGVRLEREGDTATGPRLTYRLDNDTGEMDSPVFEFPKTPERRVASRGQAARAVLEMDHKSRLLRAEYTSCPAPRDDWFLRVRELDVDSVRNVGMAYNSTVFFLGAPILYLPYMSFPLDNKRRSGFLAPTFGSSGQSGFEASLPYYWNIAPNLDATLTPKVFTKRGVQLGGEFRYLEPTFNGQVAAEYLPHDRVAGARPLFPGPGPRPAVGPRVEHGHPGADGLRRQLLSRPVDHHRRHLADEPAAQTRSSHTTTTCGRFPPACFPTRRCRTRWDPRCPSRTGSCRSSC